MTLTDTMAAALRRQVAAAPDHTLTIRQSMVARAFGCVPSHVSYVVQHRFRVQDGYVVHVQRGGGGFVRIRQVVPESQRAALTPLTQSQRLSADAAQTIIQQMQSAGGIDADTARLLLRLIAVVPSLGCADADHARWRVLWAALAQD